MKAPNKNPNCKKCGKSFRRYNTIQSVCNDCVKLAISTVKKEYKAKETAKKDALKTLSDYQKDLEKEINTIVRLIDKGHNCISCNKKPNMLFAGHYHSVGSKRPIRFHLFNIWGQCYSCNGEKGGLLLEYGQGLINNFGLELKEYCEYDLVKNFQVLKSDKIELESYRKIAKQISKFLTLENKTYAAKERIELRAKFNNMLGIYKK